LRVKTTATTSMRIASASRGYLQAVLDKDRTKAESITINLVKQGWDMLEIFKVFSESQVQIGELWAKNIITVADEHFATHITLDMISLVGRSFGKPRTMIGSVAVLSCVEGEFHYVGMKMLAEILASQGWDVHFIGQSLPIAQVIQTLKKSKKVFDIICLSITIPFNLASLIAAIHALREDPVIKRSTIIVGGRLFKSKKIQKILLKGAGSSSSDSILADFVTSNFDAALAFIAKHQAKKRRRGRHVLDK
jgi:MerR family transcriptional regulator, light-induced transcriptional regulator